MTTKNINKNLTTTLNITGSGNTWLISKDVVINSPSDGIAEAASSQNNKIVVNGTIHSPDFSDAVISAEGDDTTIEVSKTGSLSGYFGISAFGDRQSMVNYGIITSNNVAIGMGGENSHLINHGTIDAGHYALEVFQVDRATFENDGKIVTESGITSNAAHLFATFDKGSVVQSDNIVLKTYSEKGETARITNAGELTTVGTGVVIAIDVGDGREVLRNSGTIRGYVELGGGNDVYDGRGGKVINGTVIGEDGNDTYILDDKHTRVFEGIAGGHDKLTVSFTTTLELNNEIEDIRLSGKANINLHASDIANSIFGNVGSNKIFGMGGDDTMTGGKGIDRLTGGAGADVFELKPQLDKEIVTDFVNGMDHIGFVAGKEITSIGDLIHHHATDSNGDLVISGDGTEMIIKGMHKTDLSIADFMH